MGSKTLVRADSRVFYYVFRTHMYIYIHPMYHYCWLTPAMFLNRYTFWLQCSSSHLWYITWKQDRYILNRVENIASGILLKILHVHTDVPCTYNQLIT